MTGRSVPAWEGSTPDAAIPTRVRLRVFERCGGVRALSGHKIKPGDQWDVDHITPLSMGGKHAEPNLQVVWRPAHREKTAQEATARAKADRVRAKHLGTWPKSKTPLRSRGFQKTRSLDGTTGADLSPGRTK